MKIGKFIQKNRYMILTLLLIVFFFAVPYTDDDLRWGSEIGMRRLYKAFDGYGGRYFGYLIVMVLTRSQIIKSVFMGAVTTGIVYLMEKLSGMKEAFFVTLAAIILMPLAMFNNTIAWVSGFSNYMTSICGTLLFVYQLYTAFGEPEDQRLCLKKEHWLKIPALGILGFCNVLIVEHFTLLNLALCFVGIAYILIDRKRVYASHLTYAFCALAGTVLMFSNSAYRTVASGEDNYRAVKGGISPYNYKIICEYGFFGSVFVNLCICLALFWVLRDMEKRSLPKRRIAICRASAFYTAVYVAAGFTEIWQNGSAIQRIISDNAVIHVIMTTLFFGILTVAVFVIALSYKKSFELLLPLLSMLFVSAIFVAVDPVTPRCMLGSYFFELLLAFRLMDLSREEAQAAAGRYIPVMLRIVVCVGFVCFFYTLGRVSLEDRKRLQYIRSEVEKGNMQIEISHIEHEKYVHDITPLKKFEIKGYKAFYGIPEEVKLIIKE